MNLNQKYIILVSILVLAGSIFSIVIPIIDVSLFFFFTIAISVVTFLIYIFKKVFLKQKNKTAEYVKSKKTKIPTDQILYSTRSVFPFQFFPDRYIVEENGLYIIKRLFFRMSWTEMIAIKDIASVRLYSGPFFASITVYLRTVIPQRSFQFRNLWKKDALKMKETIDGLLLKHNKSIEVPQDTPLELKKRIFRNKGREAEVEKEIW